VSDIGATEDRDACPRIGRQLDAICNGFEAAWRSGGRPSLEGAVAALGADAELRDLALKELVLLDVHYRRQAGEEPEAAAYRTRFPDLDPDWLAEALSEAGTLADRRVPAALDDHPRYRVVGLLGRGGMGAVYHGEHRLMKRPVAIKVLRRAMVDRPEMVERFVAEVRMAARLAHPNIVQVFDAEEAHGTHFFAMELVTGIDLAQLVKRGPIPVAAACDYIRQAALGLQHAHEQGMTHRDIKPHNLMLADDGTVKVLDFGVARLAQASKEPTVSAADVTASAVDGASTDGADDDRTSNDATGARMLLGSADYMAPEQADDPRAADIRSDIYALGCTLYHLVAGRVPFPAPTLAGKLRAHREAEAPPLQQVRDDLSGDVSAVVARMMEKDPAQRYATPAEVAAALAPLAAPPNDGVFRSSPPRRWRWLPLVAVGLLLLGGAVWAGVVYRIQSERGELAITVDDADVEVIVKQNGKVVEILDTRTKKRLKLAPGEYDLGLASVDGFRLSLERVTIYRGEEAIAVVERVAKAAAKPAGPPADKRPEAFNPPPGLVAFFNNLGGVIARPALSADGRYVAVAPVRAAKGVGVVYDVRSRLEVGQFPCCGLAAFAGDREHIVSNVEGDRLALIEWASGKAVRAFDEAQPLMFDVDVTAEGRFALGIGKQGSTLWDVATGAVRAQRRWRTHFSSDGRHLIGFNFAGTEALVAERDGGKVIGAFDIKQEHAGHALALLPDNRTLVRCNSNTRRVELWDVAAKQKREPIDLGAAWITEDVLPAAVTADGKRLLTSHGDGLARLWDLAAGKEIWQLPVDMDVRGLTFSRDGRFAAAGTAYGMLYVWRLPDGPPYPPAPAVDRTLPDGTREHTWNTLITQCAYAPDGKHYLAIGGRSNQVRIWDDATGKLVRIVPGERWAEFHPDSKHILAGQYDGSVAVWELASGRLVRRLEGHGKLIVCLDVSRDGRRILTYSQDRTIRLWDFEQGKELDHISEAADTGSWRVVLSSDGKQAATYVEGGAVRLWDVTDGRFKLARRWELPEQERGGPLRFTADGRELVVPTNHKVRWYAAGSEKPVRTLALDGLQDAWVHWWSLSADARMLMGMSRMGGNMRVLELPTGREITRLTVPAEMLPPVGAPYGVSAVSPDGRRLVAPARYALRDLGRVYRYTLPMQ
jgi:WD40 repeat protein/serine/threonine protein kinase